MKAINFESQFTFILLSWTLGFLDISQNIQIDFATNEPFQSK